ncbi:MAG: low affinity iron permease family protein [Chthoniobacteraceae bacterium]
MNRIQDIFHTFAQRTSLAVGSPWASVLAMLTIAIWAVTGPVFGFSNTWQLVINTGTTIVTFLMVFLIQNTQNRDAKVMHLKLDELIRAVKEARNNLIDLEDMSEEELKNLEREFRKMRDGKPDPSAQV